MKERQIEAMYRARFEERRHATEALDSLYDEAAAGRDSDKRAWLIAVAHPRIPRFRDRLTREEARGVLTKTAVLAFMYAGRGGVHPLDSVDRDNPRPGLRRWVAVNTATGERSVWKEAWMSIHHDGSVTIAAAVGGHRMRSDGYFDGWQVESAAIECATADLMALVRTTAETTDNNEYDVRLGIEWTGEQPLTILTRDNSGFTYDGVSVPLHRYTPVETTVTAIEPAADFFWRVHDLAQDCVNQGGISNVLMIQPPGRDESAVAPDSFWQRSEGARCRPLREDPWIDPQVSRRRRGARGGEGLSALPRASQVGQNEETAAAALGPGPAERDPEPIRQ